MTRVAALIVALGSVVAAQQPTFKAATELVRIDTLVERDGKPVTGLTADDFEVLDNGTPQRIVTINQMADVAVGVAFDMSGSMAGDRIRHATDATLALLGQLRKEERAVVVGFTQQSSLLVPPGTAGADAARSLSAVRPAGWTALGDGAYAAVLACDTGPGSKLLVLLTDGMNNASWLTGRVVIDTARRHEVVIYPVAVGITASGLRLAANSRISEITWDGQKAIARSADRNVLVSDGDALRFLEILAKQTGGRALAVKWTDDLSAVFRGILDEYRQRYVLAFTPEGVTKGDGWHKLDVKLIRGRKGTIHARAGYWAK